jgi:hypothetical protein
MADTINADVKIQLNDGVRIYLKDSSFLTGLLYSLDPENGNVLLLFYEDDPQNMRMKMIMAHAIQRIEKDEDIHQKMTAWMHEHIDMNISSKREIRVKVSETTVTEKELHKLTQFLQEVCIILLPSKFNKKILCFLTDVTLSAIHPFSSL